MDLVLTPEQALIRDEAERLLADRAASAALRRTLDAGAPRDDALWATIGEELGWCGIAVPEAAGGLGLGALEQALVAEQLGRRLACVPFFATACLAIPLLLHAGDAAARARYLPPLAGGRTIATVALPAPGGVNPLDGPMVTARDGRLSGHLPLVVDLPGAALVLVPARTEDGIGLFALDGTDGLPATRLETLDASRPAGALHLDRTPALRVDDPPRLAAGLARCTTLATLWLAAEQLGVAHGAFELTLAYIADRVQFGRRIASFQAIKHRCARLAVDIEVARSLVLGAAAAVDGGDPAAALDVAAARAAATEAALLAAEEAIQLHGGVGFTWEYDPHLYLKRAQTSAAWLGPPEAQFERIAAHLLDGAPA